MDLARTRTAASLATLLAIAATSASAFDYQACLGTTLPAAVRGNYKGGTINRLTAPGYCRFTTDLSTRVCFPNGENQDSLTLYAWRQPCANDPKKSPIVLYEKKAQNFIVSDNRQFEPQYLAVEQGGRTFDSSSFVVSRSPVTLAPVSLGPRDDAGTVLLAFNEGSAFDPQRAFTLRYNAPGTNMEIGSAMLPVAYEFDDPAAPNYTGLWWNANESGWGINFNHQADSLFATLFTYDLAGKPMWLVMSNGARAAGTDRFEGELYLTTGSPFNAKPFVPLKPENITRVGAMSATFAAHNRGTLTYSYQGATVTKEITPQEYGVAGAPACESTTAPRPGGNYQDLWWNPNESGWGLNIADQTGKYFVTVFTYDSKGKGAWYVVPSTSSEGGGKQSGTLYSVTGPAFNAQPWGKVTSTIVGTFSMTFVNANLLTVNFRVGIDSVQKDVTRQVFAATQPLCQSGFVP
jgi:hypothetical protein